MESLARARPFPWPQSLLWRTFLLIAALMLLAVAAWVMLFERAELERRTRQIAQVVASVTNLTRAALLAAHPDHRRGLLAELSDREGIRIYPADADDVIEAPPDTAFSRHLIREIAHRLGEPTTIAFAVNGETGFFWRFRLLPDDEAEYWLALPRARIERITPVTWLLWAALVLVAALLAAWWVVWRLNRPLAALAEAARQVGAGKTAEPLPETGPAEIVTVIKAFNQMNADLARAAEERAILLAGISHDLRTPLARLRLDLEMHVADEAARAAMSADIDEMDRTVGQFLAFARPLQTEKTPVSLPALIEPLVRRHDGVQLAHEIPAIELLADGTALSRALANLIDNALRHGAPPVEIRVEKQEDTIVIEVRDHGPGIPLEALARVVKPFVRLETARSDARGAGLGLAIVERIAAQHGGYLALALPPEGGLVARLVLPLKSSRRPAPP